MKEILTVNHLYKMDILQDISFSVGEGEMVAIMGPSGSGKSTLLYNVSGMAQADGGQVYLEGQELVGLSEDEKARLRLTQMGFVFQQMNVIANLNVLDNIMLPATHAHPGKKDRARLVEKAKHLMAEYHIEDLAERKVTEVSGGQLQRACIVRSLMNDPKILFADEPTGALNKSASKEVMDSFLALHEKNTTVLMVTHDAKIASRCDRILYILDGKLQGEISLGQYEEKEAVAREKKVNNWLEELGW